MSKDIYIHGTEPSEQERLAGLNRMTNAAFIRFLDVPAGAHVLEVGSGLGLLAFDVANAAHDVMVVGVEISAAQIAKAPAHKRVTFKQGDAHTLDFPDGAFDIVYARYLLEHVADPAHVVREMRRVTKPGGTIVILNHFRSRNPVMRRIEDALAPVCAHLGWKTNLVLDPLLKTVGLTPEVVRRVNLLRGWCLVKCINPER